MGDGAAEVEACEGCFESLSNSSSSVVPGGGSSNVLLHLTDQYASYIQKTVVSNCYLNYGGMEVSPKRTKRNSAR